MEPLHRRIAVTLLALVCGACLAAGCAQLLGIDDLPEGCSRNDDCRADAPICSASGQCVAGCTNSMQCNEATPYCNTVTGGCEACESPHDDALCTMRDPEKPLCGPAGTCVACLDNAQCDESAPICGAANTCDPCQAHSDCAMYSGVCDRSAGACIPAADVVYVVEGGTGTSPCDVSSPCGSLDDALALVNQTRRFILLDDKAYPANLDLEDIAVTLIGNDALLVGTRNTPVVAVADNVSLTLEGVEVRNAVNNNTAEGIRCLASGSSTVRLDDVIVQGNGGIGIRTTSCELILDSSVVQNNLGGGIDISNSAFTIVNSFILANGSSSAAAPSNLGGVRITNNDPQTPQVFAFNTVAPCADRGDTETGILVDYDGHPRSPTAPDIGADEL